MIERMRRNASRWTWPLTSVQKAWVEALGMSTGGHAKRRHRKRRRRGGYEPTRREVRECMRQSTGAQPRGG